MANFTSLNQGNQWNKHCGKEGFNSREKIDGELNRLFPPDERITVDGKTFEKITDDAKRDYLTLFCLKPVGQSDDGGGQVYETAANGECIWDKMTPSEPCRGNEGKCQKLEKKSNLDKIVKSGSDYYYINKYGYKKPLGNNKNNFDPSCNEKQIVDGDVSEHLEYAVNYNDKLSNVLKRCDSGNYNIKYCKGNNCDIAYLSPKGEIKLYGKNTWKSMKNESCGTLPMMNAREYGFNDNHSFGNKNSNNEIWGNRNDRSFEDFGIESKLERASTEEKATILKNCHPYSGENILTDYQLNVKNKLLSDIRVKEIQKAWTTKLNKANSQFFISDDTNKPALQQELNDFYNVKTDYCSGGDSGVDCLTNNQVSEDYRKKIEILKNIETDYNTKKDSFKETERKLDTLFFQRTLWLGSAIILGAIALKQIREV